MPFGMQRNVLAATLAMVLVSTSAVAAPAPPPAPAPATKEPSAGDLATARSALREGLALREKSDLRGALARLTTAYELVQTPVTGFELGKTHMLIGHVLEAHELFKKVQRMPPALEESSRSAAAREEAGRLATSLEPRIPALRIHVKLPPGATAVVEIDEDPIALSGEVTPRAVDPGKHELVAKAGDGPEQRVTIEVAEGETKDVELAPQWIPPKAPPPSGGRVVYVRQTNPLVFIGFGGASASLVVAALTGVLAVEAGNRAEDRCGSDFCPPTVDNGGARAQARVFGAVSVVAGSAALGFLVMGIVSVSKPVHEKVTSDVTPYVGLGDVGVTGRF